MSNATCKIHGCGERVQARSLCGRHYQQAWSGKPLKTDKRGMRLSAAELFWNHVDQAPAGQCWLWKGQVDRDGYGIFTRKKLRGHRVSYEMHKGAIPEGMLIRHSCHTPRCVNPAHLSVGTHLDNRQDDRRDGRMPVNENWHSTKFTNALIAEVREANGTQRELAERFGISQQYVSEIRRKKFRPTEPDGSFSVAASGPVTIEGVLAARESRHAAAEAGAC